MYLFVILEMADMDSTAMQDRDQKLLGCFANLHMRIQKEPKLHLLVFTFLTGVFRFRNLDFASTVILRLSKTRSTAESV